MTNKVSKDTLFYILVSLLSVFLLLFNLGQTSFWDDEAMVYWFAHNYNYFGKIISYDGHNIFSYRNGTLFHYNNPPLDIYWAAFLQRMGLKSTEAIRMGFAILSIGSIYIYYKIIHQKIHQEVWRKFAFACFVLNINFILFSQNVRYYSLVIFFGLLTYYACDRYIKTLSRKKSIIWASVILIGFNLLFYAHYTQAFAWIAFCYFIFFFHKNIIQSIKDNRYLVLGMLFSMLSWFYYGYTTQIHIRNDLKNTDFILIKYLKLSAWFLNDLNRFNTVPIIFLILFVLYIIFNKKQRKSILKENIWITQAAIFSLFSVIFSPQDTSHSISFDFRYIVVGLFLYTTAFSYFFYKLWDKYSRYRVLTLMACVLFLTSTFWTMFPDSVSFRWTIPAHIYAKATGYTSPVTELIKYLDTVSGGQTICDISENNNTTVMAYYSEKFKISNSVDSGKYLQDSIVKKYHQRNIYKSNIPDIVALFGDRGNELNDYNIDTTLYDWIDTLDVFSTYLEYSRPELPWHHFHTQYPTNPKDALIIYRMKK